MNSRVDSVFPPFLYLLDMSRTNFFEGRSPSRHFDIITNHDFTPYDPRSLPKITLTRSNVKPHSPSLHSTVNRSHYDFNIINQRTLNDCLVVEPQRVTNKKVYMATKFSQDTDLSGLRFREKYGELVSNKNFNRKRGLVREFLGNEVNTVTNWLKRN